MVVRDSALLDMATRDPLDLTDGGRLRRLEALDELLPTLTGVLDVREVFVRISEIARKVLPHDFMGLPLADDDSESERRCFLDGPWDHIIIPDIREDPVEGELGQAKAGFRSLLRLPLRLKERFLGTLDFYSLALDFYQPSDVLIGRRVADHMVLALSHQRLAEEGRRADELHVREANLELLDELLATVTETGELAELFDRISSIAKKVLPHDALTLPILMEDGLHARIYAGSGYDLGAPQQVVRVPDEVLRDERDYYLIDDLTASGKPHDQRAAAGGFRSSLRVPIRLDGRLAGGLSFASRKLRAFTPADALIGRRIAARVALSLSRERGLAAARRADEATERASRLEARVRALTEELDLRPGYRRPVGTSPEWRQVLTQAAQVAATDATVLLLGESGTGKEVVARFLHRASERKNGPFVALNCAALPEHLLEAELFGYERGAFTGATQSKPGQLEQASGGTMLLDEVGEMSLAAQAKFLRVLQEREFQRLGGTRVLRTDARIVAATNRDLQRALAQGAFREDLYYRLNVFAIPLPPLRARREDILPLSEAFVGEIGRGIGRPPAGISRDARALLKEYDWPGNVRELRNILERAAILCDGGLITSEHLALTAALPAVPARRPDPAPAAAFPATAGSDLQSVERAMIEQALQNSRFNKSKAAKELGLTRTQLYVRMRRYGLS